MRPPGVEGGRWCLRSDLASRDRIGEQLGDEVVELGGRRPLRQADWLNRHRHACRHAARDDRRLHLVNYCSSLYDMRMTS